MQKMDINMATYDDLVQIKGIGDRTATKILYARKAAGGKLSYHRFARLRLANSMIIKQLFSFSDNLGDEREASRSPEVDHSTHKGVSPSSEVDYSTHMDVLPAPEVDITTHMDSLHAPEVDHTTLKSVSPPDIHEGMDLEGAVGGIPPREIPEHSLRALPKKLDVSQHQHGAIHKKPMPRPHGVPPVTPRTPGPKEVETSVPPVMDPVQLALQNLSMLVQEGRKQDQQTFAKQFDNFSRQLREERAENRKKIAELQKESEKDRQMFQKEIKSLREQQAKMVLPKPVPDLPTYEEFHKADVQQEVETALEFDQQIEETQERLEQLSLEKRERLANFRASRSGPPVGIKQPSNNQGYNAPRRDSYYDPSFTPRVNSGQFPNDGRDSRHADAMSGLYDPIQPTQGSYMDDFEDQGFINPVQQGPTRRNFGSGRHSTPREGTERTSEKSLPKLSKYDGKSQWKSFYMQFETHAYLKNWTIDEKLFHLRLNMKDDALDFVSCQPMTVKRNFPLIVEKLERRFGKKDLPETLRSQFAHIKQKIDEPLEEWAERVQRLAQDAFAELPETFMDEQIIQRFCQGIVEKETAQYASDCHPRTIEEALRLVKAHVHNSRAIFGSRKPAVRNISTDGHCCNAVRTLNCDNNSDMWSCSSHQTCQEEVNNADLNPSVRALRSQGNPLDKKFKTLEECFQNNFDKLFKLLSSQRSAPRDRSYSPPPSPSRSRVCYKCKQEGHFANNCTATGILKNSPSSPGSPSRLDNQSTAPKNRVAFNTNSPLNKNRSDV